MIDTFATAIKVSVSAPSQEELALKFGWASTLTQIRHRAPKSPINNEYYFKALDFLQLSHFLWISLYNNSDLTSTTVTRKHETI